MAKSYEIDPKRMGGSVCMVGTRMPVRQLLIYLVEAGMDNFLKDFDHYTEEQIWAVVREVTDKIQEWVERDEDERA